MKDSEQGIVCDGVEIAPGVAETIVSLAAAEVEGVAGVGSAGAFSAIMSAFSAGKAVPTAGVELSAADEGGIDVDITIQVKWGFRIVEVASAVRTAVADALTAQLGATVASVDVAVDGLEFGE